jgi:hypothetical protein
MIGIRKEEREKIRRTWMRRSEVCRRTTVCPIVFSYCLAGLFHVEGIIILINSLKCLKPSVGQLTAIYTVLSMIMSEATEPV